MAYSHCSVSLVGNIGRDPEVRVTTNGQTVASFSVAVSQPGKRNESGGFDPGPTDWYVVSAWGTMADAVASTLKRGQRVFLQGNLKQRSYEAKDGSTKVSLDVDARSFVPMAARADAPTDDIASDDVPF